MKKKYLGMVLSLVGAACLYTGCGSDSGNSSNNNNAVECDPECGDNQECVNGECKDKAKPAQCDPECNADTEECVNGECKPKDNGNNGNNNTKKCTNENETECSGECFDLSKDNNNCGTCGHACDTANGESCEGGVCQKVPQNCKPGCLIPENTKLITCNEDGTAVETPCPYGCVDNACIEPECDFEETYCENGELVTCQDHHIIDRNPCEYGCLDGKNSCNSKYKSGEPCDDNSFTTICEGKNQISCDNGQINLQDCTKIWGSDGICLQRTLDNLMISTICQSTSEGKCTELNAVKLLCDENNKYLQHYDCLSDGKNGLYWSNTVNWRELPNRGKNCAIGCQENHCLEAPIGTVKSGNCQDFHTCADILDSNYSCVYFDEETYRCMRPCEEDMNGLNGYESHASSCYYYECKKLGDSWWFDYIRQDSYTPCNKF